MKAWEKSFLWFPNALHAVYISSSFILTTCAVVNCDLRGKNGPMCQDWGGVATCAVLDANLYLYLWRVSDKLLVDESKFYSVLLCISVTTTICLQKFTSGCYSSKNGVVHSSAADKTGALHEKGRKHKHRWRWHGGSDVASLWGILHLERHECCFVSSQNFGVNFW